MDGRHALELRSLEIQLSPHTASTASLLPIGAAAMGRPTGSAQVVQGLTSVSAFVFGPREPGRVSRASAVRGNRAGLHVEVAVAPWGSVDRRYRSRNDRHIVEWANAIQSTFNPVIHTHLYPRSQIDIVVQVLQQDGGVLPTAINACTLALMDAGISMSDYVTALTCGLYGSTSLLDLNLAEQTDLPYVTMAILPRSERLPLLTLDTRLHIDRFDAMVGVSIEAAQVIRDAMDAAMRARTGKLLKAMNGEKGEKDLMQEDM
ncbi:Exosome non-catalytic core component [Malassezia vespertilionis]|uniref:Ribosomal RNA-processing protein 41 n=1 Tax=Malassezia vespertilionis TaxID=2020962 RepID=A0A2N1J9R4_9BASI|nr:Exosome non-catalytic core component [Malassezia vespertilionis]PKI83288.1 Ski6p [Malassezia vespertilionis]WFD07837.1 Exosome non-catalytic core component [Malassezia vespertilionis]